MSHAVRSLLWCLLFVATAEAGYRSFLGQPEGVVELTEATSTSQRPLVFLLGSSRTGRALVPAVIEERLAAAGVADPWVANVWRPELTQVGLYRHYVRELQPLLRGSGASGVVAIEVRGAALNDRRLGQRDRTYITKTKLPPLAAVPKRADVEPTPETSTATSDPPRPPAAGLSELADSAFARVQLFRGRRDLFERIELRSRALRQAELAREGEGLLPLLEAAPWGTGAKGWEGPTGEGRTGGDLEVDKWRERYEDDLLRGYKLGGVQSEYLRRLVRAIRADGFTPLLYTLPITETHRGFYAEDDYEVTLRYVARVAEEEGATFVDLDTDHGYTNDEFRDTHHLGRPVIEPFSRRFAERALLPLL